MFGVVRYTHLRVSSLWCMYVVCGARFSMFSNDYKSSFELHESRRTYRSATTQIGSLSVGVCDFWVAWQSPHQQRNIFETCISNKEIQSQMRKFTITYNVQLRLPRVVVSSQSCRHNSGMFTSSFGVVEHSISIVVSSRRMAHPDDLRAQRNPFPIHNLNQF